MTTEWKPCVKLPVTVHVREQQPEETHVSTREGITPLNADDLIMRGVQGEEYPIGRELFELTYRLLDESQETEVSPTDEELAATIRNTYPNDEQGEYSHKSLLDGDLMIARAVLEKYGK